MLKVLAIASGMLLATTATAQTTQSSHNPAMKSGHAAAVTNAASGSNSFTQDQARGRLEKAGYAKVSKLTKDKHGVWRGTATKNGKAAPVGLDYKGNVTTN